jgi:cytochrome P450
MYNGGDLVDDAKKLEDLPREILKEILKSVSDQDLDRLARVSRQVGTWAKEEKRDRARAAFNQHVNDFITRARAAQRDAPDGSDDELWK